MPIYEYTCSKCNSTIEVIQKFSDKPLSRHAGCGGKLSKLISQSAFQLKGSGWYVTDYARKGNGGESTASGSDAASTETAKKTDTGSGGTEAKPSTPAKESPPTKKADSKSEK